MYVGGGIWLKTVNHINVGSRVMEVYVVWMPQ